MSIPNGARLKRQLSPPVLGLSEVKILSPNTYKM